MKCSWLCELHCRVSGMPLQGSTGYTLKTKTCCFDFCNYDTKDNVSRDRCAFTLLRVSKEPVRHKWKSWAQRDNLRFTVITLFLTFVWVTLGKSNYVLCVLVSTSTKCNIISYEGIFGLITSSGRMVWCYTTVTLKYLEITITMIIRKPGKDVKGVRESTAKTKKQ